MFEVVNTSFAYGRNDSTTVDAFETESEAKAFAAEFGGKVRELKLTPAEQKRAALMASFGKKYVPKRVESNAGWSK